MCEDKIISDYILWYRVKGPFSLFLLHLTKLFLSFSLQFNVFKLDSLAPFIHNDDNKWFCNKDDTCYQNWLDMKFPPNAVWDKQYKTPCYTDYMTGRFRVGQIYHHNLYSEVFSVLFSKHSQIDSVETHNRYLVSCCRKIFSEIFVFACMSTDQHTFMCNIHWTWHMAWHIWAVSLLFSPPWPNSLVD